MGRGRVWRWQGPVLEAAAEAVVGGQSYRRVSALSGLPASTIRRYVVSQGLVISGVRRGGRSRRAASTLVGWWLADGGMVCDQRKRRAGALSANEREEIRVGIDTG